MWAVQKTFCFIIDFYPFGCRADTGHQQNNICILTFPFNREILGQFLTCTDNPFFAILDVKVKVAQSCLTLQLHVQGPARLLYPWNSPGKNIGVGSCSFSRGSSQPRDWTQVSALQADSLPSELPGKLYKYIFVDVVTFCLPRFFFF